MCANMNHEYDNMIGTGKTTQKPNEKDFFIISNATRKYINDFAFFPLYFVFVSVFESTIVADQIVITDRIYSTTKAERHKHSVQS